MTRFPLALEMGYHFELALLQRGPVAQLGARMNGIHEVTGSIPVWSTKLSFGPSMGLKYLKADDVTDPQVC